MPLSTRHIGTCTERKSERAHVMPDTSSTIVQVWQGILQQTVKKKCNLKSGRKTREKNNNFLQLCTSAEYVNRHSSLLSKMKLSSKIKEVCSVNLYHSQKPNF